jgi:hypothetical protein
MDDPQLEELIKEIATKHGIVVSRDDPILVLQTINNRLLQDGAKAQQVQLDQYKEELEALALRWGNDAKDKAERILTASLSAGRDAMALHMQEAARTTAATVAAEVETGMSRVRASIQDARSIATMNIVAACMTMGAAAIVLWVAQR